ncbi:MAG: hypothetical protein PHF84_00445 [bacterium]|nr:hypothetical protein [bacterium]
MNRKFLIIMLTCTVIIVGIMSCSVFDGLYPDKDTGTTDAADLVEMGDIAMQKGEVAAATNYYARAVRADGRNSKARRGYARANILLNNANLIWLASKMSSGQDSDLPGLITASAGGFLGTMDVVIAYLGPISEGRCDGAVSAYDFEINMNLMLAYFIRGFLRNGDSNGDSIYFSTAGPGGGDLFIFDNGNLGYNPAVADITTLQNNIEGDLSAIESSLPTMASIQRSTISNLIWQGHDINEALLLVYKTFGSSFVDFTGASSSLNKAVAGLTSGGVMDDIRNDINERYTEMSAYLTGADTDANNLNNDHVRIVGVNVPGYISDSVSWYASFSKSVWPHAFVNSTDPRTGMTNLYYKFVRKPGDFFTNLASPQTAEDLKILQQTTNTMLQLMRDVENANLIKNLMGSGS